MARKRSFDMRGLVFISAVTMTAALTACDLSQDLGDGNQGGGGASDTGSDMQSGTTVTTGTTGSHAVSVSSGMGVGGHGAVSVSSATGMGGFGVGGMAVSVSSATGMGGHGTSSVGVGPMAVSSSATGMGGFGVGGMAVSVSSATGMGVGGMGGFSTTSVGVGGMTTTSIGTGVGGHGTSSSATGMGVGGMSAVSSSVGVGGMAVSSSASVGTGMGSGCDPFPGYPDMDTVDVTMTGGSFQGSWSLPQTICGVAGMSFPPDEQGKYFVEGHRAGYFDATGAFHPEEYWSAVASGAGSLMAGADVDVDVVIDNGSSDSFLPSSSTLAEYPLSPGGACTMHVDAVRPDGTCLRAKIACTGLVGASTGDMFTVTNGVLVCDQ
jgi:hypothetical protein